MLDYKNKAGKYNIPPIDLVLNDGDFVTVIGGNGAGKSTLLNAIAGVWRLDCGTVLLDGHDVTAMPEYKRAKFLGRVFQRQSYSFLKPSPHAVRTSLL